MIQTIYFSNILEGCYSSYKGLKSKEEKDFWTRYDSYDSNRAVLYGDDNKTIVTAYAIYKPHFEDIKKLMGWKEVYNVSPQKPTYSISEDCIKDTFLRNTLVGIIKNNPGVALIPYRLTPQFQKLIHYLKTQDLSFKTPETIAEEKQFILNYFNTKRGFRHLWHLSGAENAPHIQIPQGFITQNKKEAIDGAWWFKQRDESFVIKYNSGTQGIGVQLIDRKTLPSEKRIFEKHMRNLLKDKMWSEPIIIIEKAIPSNDKEESVSPSLEVYIDPNGTVSPSYVSDQIMANDKRTFRGIYIYPELMTDPFIKKAFESGVKFGKALAKYGYRGVFDIDLMRSKHNELFAVEANLRRTGGTHLHELCLALLGKEYGHNYHTLIEDIILNNNHKLTYGKCRSLFVNDLYTNKKQSGIIFANPDMLKVNILVVILIAKTKKQIVNLRKKINDTLSGIITDQTVAVREQNISR